MCCSKLAGGGRDTILPCQACWSLITGLSTNKALLVDSVGHARLTPRGNPLLASGFLATGTPVTLGWRDWPVLFMHQASAKGIPHQCWPNQRIGHCNFLQHICLHDLMWNFNCFLIVMAVNWLQKIEEFWTKLMDKLALAVIFHGHGIDAKWSLDTLVTCETFFGWAWYPGTAYLSLITTETLQITWPCASLARHDIDTSTATSPGGF